MPKNLSLPKLDKTKLLLALALLAQTPHTADLFHQISPHALEGGKLEWLHAWVYAVALESAVFLFVARGRIGWGNLFAVVSVAVNVGYYWRDGWILFPQTEADWVRFWEILPDMLRAALISGILPLAIARYSHEIVSHNHTPEPSQIPVLPEKPRVVARPVLVSENTPAPLVAPPETTSAPLAPWLEKTPEPKTKRASKQAAVFEYLNEHPNATYIAISETCGVSVEVARQYAHRWRKSLKLVEAIPPQEVHTNGIAH